jgi:hypothetical protein
MPRGKSLTLTDQAILGLFFIQRYRFLTIDQFARAAAINRSTASDQLRFMEWHDLLGHCGNTGLPGHGKTPKVYFLTRKGWEILLRESDIPPELIGGHKQVHLDARWSPQMYHRLRTVEYDDLGRDSCPQPAAPNNRENIFGIQNGETREAYRKGDNRLCGR